MAQPIQTASYWDETADSYIAAAEPFTAHFCRKAVELAEIERGTTLLDIATGPGALALAAARAGARVTAIDFSQGMIDRLAARGTGLSIEALQMNGQALAFPSDQFDRVCSVFGIPLFPDWRAGLSEMARVLRPGGRAVLGVAANPYGFGPNQLFAEARRQLWPEQEIDMGLPGMASLYAGDRIVFELENTGLKGVVLHSASHDMTLPADILLNNSPMIRSNPLLIGLSEADRNAVIAQATRTVRPWLEGDVIRMPSIAHLAVAMKSAASPSNA